MAEDSDEEMPVIDLGAGGRRLSMEAGRAHQEEDSDDEPIAGSGHRELEFQTGDQCYALWRDRCDDDKFWFFGCQIVETSRNEPHYKVKWDGGHEEAWAYSGWVTRTEPVRGLLVRPPRWEGDTREEQRKRRRITRASNPILEKRTCTWTAGPQHADSEWVPKDLVRVIEGRIAEPEAVADASHVTCPRSMDLDEALCLVHFDFWLQRNEQAGAPLTLAHQDVPWCHSRLRGVLNHLKKLAKHEATPHLTESFPGYVVLVNTETQRIISISKEVPKSSWVTAFRQFDKAVGTGAESKQHIIQTHQGTHIGLADFHAVCKSLRAEHRGWDGYLLYET